MGKLDVLVKFICEVFGGIGGLGDLFWFGDVGDSNGMLGLV